MGFWVWVSWRKEGSAQGGRHPTPRCGLGGGGWGGRSWGLGPGRREVPPGGQATRGGGREGLLLSIGALWSSAGLQDRRTWLCFSR